MKEAMGTLKSEMDFVLPRSCKRARSSVQSFRNIAWELSKRPRRAVLSPEGPPALSEVAKLADDQDEDLGEIALALLEMSSPRDATAPAALTPPSGSLQTKGGIKSSQSALHLKSNTLSAKPTIIITSGSSAESGLAESKSNTSSLLEGSASAGQTNSPLSNHGSETVAFLSSHEISRPGQAVTISCAASQQDPKQGLDAVNSLPATDRSSSPAKIGRIVSTGISLPSILQRANTQVRQETALGSDPCSSTPPESEQQRPLPAAEMHTQLILQAIQKRTARKGQEPGRPIAKTRGGNLIVMPDPVPNLVQKAQPGLSPGTSVAQLNLEDIAPSRAASPAGFAPGLKETSQLTLCRYPTLVLSSAHKPSKARASSESPVPRPPVAVSTAGLKQEPVKDTPSAQVAPKELVQPVSAFANKGGEGPASAQGPKEGPSSAGQGASSGEESSEDDWLPNWSVNLYNALNPTVITTGHNYLGMQSTSQTVDGKATPQGK